MKTEGIAEIKELDRVIHECAAIKRERDKLREIKEDLEMELQKRENTKPYLDEVIKERDSGSN
jgi:aspartate oxidase